MTTREQKVDESLQLSFDLGTKTHWYVYQLSKLRCKWYSNLEDDTAERRYRRLHQRWVNEVRSVGETAERLMNEARLS